MFSCAKYAGSDSQQIFKQNASHTLDVDSTAAGVIGKLVFADLFEHEIAGIGVGDIKTAYR